MLSPQLRNKGFSIVEVLIATILLSITVVGMSQLMTAGMGQQQLDIKQGLAALSVNNGAERFLSTVRDNCGPNSFTKSSIGGCTTGKTFIKLYDKSYHDNSPTTSPFPSELMTLCPSCQMDVNFTCDSSDMWQGYVQVIDAGNSNQILASVTPEYYQPLCN